jgi:hypothetical protein
MAVGGVYRVNDVTPNQSLGIIGSKVWRMAPLSAIGIGTSWSLQDLWAAPWLRDVARLDRASVVDHLSVMAFVVCASALLLGTLTKSLQRRGIKTEWVLAGTLPSRRTRPSRRKRAGWIQRKRGTPTTIPSDARWESYFARSIGSVIFVSRELTRRARVRIGVFAALQLTDDFVTVVCDPSQGKDGEQWLRRCVDEPLFSTLFPNLS